LLAGLHSLNSAVVTFHNDTMWLERQIQNEILTP
jgi:hypothetical protein